MSHGKRAVVCLSSRILLAAFLVYACAAGAQAPQLRPAAPDAIRRWQDMRFGMFIHWGPVSITGREIGWSRGAETPVEVYDDLYRQFNPKQFNAEEWARIARDAGMKYLVLVTKHHDGFSMWDTQQTDYNIMRTPFARDVVKELSAACKKYGIAFGTYYSVCDWHHPDFPLGSPGGKTKKPNPNLDRYTEYLRAQVTELIRNYGPLLEMWFDVPQETGPERGIPNANLVRSLQPDILINDRAGGTPGDFDTPEQRIGGFNMERPWETCMTICRQWAWKPDDTMKSLQQCLRTLVSTAGGNGNLLFNVGPMPDGRIEPRQVERLKEMGAWLKKYGASVYGTRGGPFRTGKWGASTRAGNRIYLHVYQWDGTTLQLPAVPAKVTSARVLTGGKLSFQQTGSGLALSLAAGDQDPIDTLIALDLDRPAMELAPVRVTVPSASLAANAQARASNVYRSNPQYGAEKAVDDDIATRWATDSGTKQAWLEIDLGKPATFSRVAIREWEGGGNRVQKFELQYQDLGSWKTIVSGTTIGTEYIKDFPAVTARIVRLNILDATEGPTIDEFEILK
jgi:alpha-L-fucosidase